MAKIDIKKAAINHVEKVIFGVVILIVLIGLAGAQWSPYKGTPGEIDLAVKTGKRNLINQTWPEEEKQNYPIVRTDTLVDRALYASIDPRPLESSVDPVVDPVGRNEPVREPVLKTLEDLVATSGRVFLETIPSTDEVSTETEVAAVTEDKKDDDDLLDELRVRDSARRGAGGGAMGELGGELGAGYDDYAIELSDDMSSEAAYAGIPGGEYTDLGEFGESGMAGPALPTLSGQGYHFVSVRAVFPLREQISKFADATNQSYQQAAATFDIIDFELQRQQMQKGPNPWPEGEDGWENVDINVAKDILDSTAGFEADVVNSVVTNGVITMPLPMRISGEWRRQATHDRIKNFELTDEQVQIEMEMNRALLQQAVESKKTLRQSTVQRGGFNDFQFDSREMQGALMGNENIYAGMGAYGGGGYGEESFGGPGGMGAMAGAGMPGGRPGSGRGTRRGTTANANNPLEELITKLAEDSEDSEAKEKAIRQWIMERASVDGELLLFRYFDFSVEPGKTYRYRVRLILQNPNFGKRIADAGGLAHVVAGETRTTDWSNVTPPIAVADDLRFFLTRVNEPKGSSRLLPAAQMDVYQWDSKYGTMVNKSFEVRMGQPIADEVKTEVIDAAGQKAEEMDYTFKADSFLVDAIQDIDIEQSFHSNDRIDASLRLDLMRGHRDHFRNTGRVLIKEDGEELVGYEESGQTKLHEFMKTYMEKQKEQFDFLFKSQTALTDAAGFGEYSDLIGAGGGAYGGESMEEMYGGRSRGRNALRKGGSRRSSGRSGSRGVEGGRSGSY